ncbi:MAG TPA: hypothetical protein VF337_09865 [Candidatus Limnocylindrales bacterium]
MPPVRPPAPEAPALPPASPIAAFTPAAEKPVRKESIPELIAFGLAVAGAALGIASLFLPWANGQGIGIGNYSTHTPPPDQWGWGMPSAVPLFLLSLLVLGAVSGSDVSQARLPHLASPIRQVTDLILPLVLGGLYLGVFLLYFTLPGSHAYGVGTVILFLAGCSLIGGGVTALFFPPEPGGADTNRAGRG